MYAVYNAEKYRKKCRAKGYGNCEVATRALPDENDGNEIYFCVIPSH